MLDFVSSWFRVYSIYLAGPRTEKVSNGLENLILSVYRGSQIGHMIITLLAEVWVLTYFIKYSYNESLKEFYNHEYYETVKNVAKIGAYLRMAILVIELKQAFYRIIDLDVDDYKLKAEKKESSP